jgi:hypothetical protein
MLTPTTSQVRPRVLHLHTMHNRSASQRPRFSASLLWLLGGGPSVQTKPGVAKTGSRRETTCQIVIMDESKKPPSHVSVTRMKTMMMKPIVQPTKEYPKNAHATSLFFDTRESFCNCLRSCIPLSSSSHRQPQYKVELILTSGKGCERYDTSTEAAIKKAQHPLVAPGHPGTIIFSALTFDR